MSVETWTLLLNTNTLERVDGSLTDDPNQSDRERPRRRQDRKLNDASGFTEELSDLTERDPKKTDPLYMDADLIQIFIKSIGGKHFCL